MQKALLKHEEVTQEALSEREQEMQGALSDPEEETQEASSDPEVETQEIISEHKKGSSKKHGFEVAGRTCALEIHHQRCKVFCQQSKTSTKNATKRVCRSTTAGAQ